MIIYEQVVKTVYASPSRVNFQLDHKKVSCCCCFQICLFAFADIFWNCCQATETLPAYPNICFSVDDFDDTFDAVVSHHTWNDVYFL